MVVHFKEGVSYRVEEELGEKTYDAFSTFLGDGRSGLLLTARNPKLLSILDNGNNFDLEVYWMTQRIGKKNIPPHSVGIIGSTILKCLEEKEKPVIVIDGIERVLTHSTSSDVLHILEQVVDEVSEKKANMVIRVHPPAVEEYFIENLKPTVPPLRID